MKILEFIEKSCKDKGVSLNVELCVRSLVNPANDMDHDLTQEEMVTIDAFIDRFCDGLSNLVRNASSTAHSILRQTVDYRVQFEAVNTACKWLWQQPLK